MLIKAGYIMSFLTGLSYVVHSFGIPIGSILLKPYQLLAMVFSYKVVNKRFQLGLIALMFLHSVLTFIGRDFDSDVFLPYVFILMLVVFSSLLMVQLTKCFRETLTGVSILYFIGIFSYLYGMYTGSYLNIHVDAPDRAFLSNSIYAFTFFDGKTLRYNGFALDPNFFSFYVNVLLGISLLLAKRKNEAIPVFFIILSIASVVLSLSRVGALCLVLLLVSWRWGGVSLIKKITILFVISISVFLFAIISESLGRSVFNYQDVSGSRLIVWVYHFNNILEKVPLLIGNGITFDVVRYVEAAGGKSTHNSLLYLAYCTGLVFPIFVLFLWLKRSLNILFKSNSDERSLLLALHFVVGFGFFTLDLIFTVPVYLYIIFCVQYKRIKSF